MLVDVRPAEQFAICHLPGALHAPYKHFARHLPTIRERLGLAPHDAPVASAAAAGEQPPAGGSGTPPPLPLYVVCRRGNDSQRAVAALRVAGVSHGMDVVGGLEAWSQQVDPSFPTY